VEVSESEASLNNKSVEDSSAREASYTPIIFEDVKVPLP
jgi:hypothetical protein